MSGPQAADDARAAKSDGRLPFAVWLLPDQASSRRWQVAIDRLAASHDGPPFTAHVTLHVGTLPALFDPMPALRDVASRGMPLILEAAANESSDSYFKALYTPFRGPSSSLDALESLRESLIGAWAAAERLPDAAHDAAVEAALAGYALEPHLSLLYAQLDATQRATLAAAHEAAGTLVRFDRLALVTPRPGARDLGAVDRWEVSEDCRLGPTVNWRDGRRR